MLNVLLADGSGDVLKAFELGLQDSSVVCVTSNVVDEALRLRPDMVFLDVLLEPDNGYEIARKIKSKPLLERTKVVMMWNDFLTLDRDQFLASGADSHLKKPFNAQSLKNLTSSLFPAFENIAPNDSSKDLQNEEFSNVPISSLKPLDLGKRVSPLGLNTSYNFDDSKTYASDSKTKASDKLDAYDLNLGLGDKNHALSKEEQIEILENKTQRMVSKLLPNIVTRCVKEEIKKLMAASEAD